MKLFFSLLKNIDISSALLIVGLDFLVLYIKTLRWGVLLSVKKQDIKNVAPLRLYYCNIIGAFFGTFTPGRLGEFGKVYYLRQKNDIPYELALGSSIVDRLFDLLFIVIVVLGFILANSFGAITASVSIFFALILMWLIS